MRFPARSLLWIRSCGHISQLDLDVGTNSDSAMAQARVTDFFAQRKSGVDPGSGLSKSGKATTRSTRSKVVHPKAATRTRSDSVQDEFLRVIDEATGVVRDDREGGISSKPGPVLSTHEPGDFPASPRTPKRTCDDAEFDLGAAVFDTTAEHSTAKKRRAGRAVSNAVAACTEAKPAARSGTKTARKKLILGQNPKPTAQPNEVDMAKPATLTPTTAKSPSHHADGQSSRQEKQASKVLSSGDIAALKARLQKIKKQAATLPALETPAPPAPETPAPLTPAPEIRETPAALETPAPPAPETTEAPAPLTLTPAPETTEAPAPPSTSLNPAELAHLKATVGCAKEVAARLHRRKETREVAEGAGTVAPPEDSASLPAYQRYHALAQPVPPGLALPYTYKLLAEMFRNADTIVGMLYNRSETPTFSRVQQGVQDIMHKRFDETHLGQIKTVLPDAYKFRQEKNLPSYSNNVKKGSHQLTMEPVLRTDQNEALPILTASRLLERRRAFHHELVSIVKQHHKTFLASLVPPLSVPEDRLTRWHPRFNVDLVPPVPGSPLPQAPSSEGLTSARDVLAKARLLMTPKMEKALVSMASRVTPEPSVATPTPPVATATPALRGVSNALLERIRAKEAQKLQAAMTRDPAQEERLLMMSRLCELARILRNVFVADRKACLPMEVVCGRMAASYRSALSQGEMEKHLRLLAELAPNWLSVQPIRKDFYLKLSKNMDLNHIVEQLNAKLKEEQRL